jgi:hypothetical protein
MSRKFVAFVLCIVSLTGFSYRSLAESLPGENASQIRKSDPHIRCHRNSGNAKAPAERALRCKHVLFQYNKYDRAYRCVCSPK